jgi:hypothetical protein
MYSLGSNSKFCVSSLRLLIIFTIVKIHYLTALPLDM